MSDPIDVIFHLFHHPKLPRASFQVAVAGSFSLYCFMKKVLDKEPNFVPNDCDIYVLSETIELFNDYVSKFLSFASETFPSSSVRLTLPRKCSSYSLPEMKEVTVRDLKLSETFVKLSFIHYQGAKVIDDVVGNFDIDIVTVSFDIFRKSFRLTSDTKLAISAMKATVVRPFVFKDSVPTDNEQQSLHETFDRMRKYKKRGFSFTNVPTIVTKSDVKAIEELEDEDEKKQEGFVDYVMLEK